MAYATALELKSRIGRSIFEEIYATNESDAEGDLAAAEAEVDGALAYRYRLPVTGLRSLALLKDWTLTLAEEHAFARPAGGNYTEKVKSRLAQVRLYLTQVREDAFRLPDAEENGSGSGFGGVALVQCDDPVFGRDKMRGF